MKAVSRTAVRCRAGALLACACIAPASRLCAQVPAVSLVPGGEGNLTAHFEGLLEASTDLQTWAPVDSVDGASHLFTTVPSALFLRARSADPRTLPLLQLEDFAYVGAFRLSAGGFGNSSLNYSQGPIAYHPGRHSLFIVGHTYEQAIAEFPIPALVQSTAIAELNRSETPLQPFASVIPRAPTGNAQSIDRISGLFFDGQRLIINAFEYYDAPGDDTDTTLVLDDPDDLAGSPVRGFFRLEGRAHASGWIAEVPPAWQGPLGGRHLTGFSSGWPIIGRLSVGPSAFAFDLETFAAGSATEGTIPTKALLDFSLDHRLADDLSNSTGENMLWTHLSGASYGFIVPGTRTYVTLGSSGGHATGVGYKITQDDGNLCGGYCSYAADDNDCYYWLWDLNALEEAGQGLREPYSILPYDQGIFPAPFQGGDVHRIGGGAYDAATGTLYLTLQGADTEAGTYSNPPIVVVYQFPDYTPAP